MARLALAAALTAAAAAHAVPPACDVTKSGNEVCDDYCNYRCSFYNTSRGETGALQRATIYRLTPANVTGVRNKDTGDARGDIGFWLYHKNTTQLCAEDPSRPGCFLDGNDLYGMFVIEFDGQWGPYLQCNPEQLGGTDPVLDPVWEDDRNFMCGQDCLNPTATGCHSEYHMPQINMSNDGFFGPKCYCNGTQRQLVSVGRAEPTFLQGGHGWGKPGVPTSWAPQCQQGYKEIAAGHCLSGNVSQKLQAWSFDSAAAMACEACADDDNCTGWSTPDNRTVLLFNGNVTTVEGNCTGVVIDGPFSKQKSWYGVGALGGYWYSTPLSGECPDGAPIGTDGCTWRQVSSVYKNATCINRQVDASVERWNSKCMGACPQPLNRTSDCYLTCYRDALMGNAGKNTTKIPQSKVIDPWVDAFTINEPSKGGCAEVTPPPCEGVQCDPRLRLPSIVI